jgi:hypothetical protein
MKVIQLFSLLTAVAHAAAATQNAVPSLRANRYGIDPEDMILAKTQMGRRVRRGKKVVARNSPEVVRKLSKKEAETTDENDEAETADENELEVLNEAQAENENELEDPNEAQTADENSLEELKSKMLSYQAKGSISDSELDELDREFEEVMGMTIQQFLVQIAANEDLLNDDDKQLVEFLRSEYEVDALKAKVLSYQAKGYISDYEFEELDREFEEVMGLTIEEFLLEIAADEDWLNADDKQLVEFLRSEYEDKVGHE